MLLGMATKVRAVSCNVVRKNNPTSKKCGCPKNPALKLRKGYSRLDVVPPKGKPFHTFVEDDYNTAAFDQVFAYARVQPTGTIVIVDGHKAYKTAKGAGGYAAVETIRSFKTALKRAMAADNPVGETIKKAAGHVGAAAKRGAKAAGRKVAAKGKEYGSRAAAATGRAARAAGRKAKEKGKEYGARAGAAAKRGAKAAGRKVAAKGKEYGARAGAAAKKAARRGAEKGVELGERAARRVGRKVAGTARGAAAGLVKGWKENPTGIYKQTFQNGDEIYFVAETQQKNKGWAGRMVRFENGRAQKPKKTSVSNFGLWTRITTADVPTKVLEKFGVKVNPITAAQRRRMNKSMFALPELRKYRLDSPARCKYTLTLLNKHYEDGARTKKEYETAYTNIMVAFLKNGQIAKRPPLVKTPLTNAAFKAASPLKNPEHPVSRAQYVKALELLARNCKTLEKAGQMTKERCTFVQKHLASVKKGRKGNPNYKAAIGESVQFHDVLAEAQNAVLKAWGLPPGKAGRENVKRSTEVAWEAIDTYVPIPPGKHYKHDMYLSAADAAKIVDKAKQLARKPNPTKGRRAKSTKRNPSKDQVHLSHHNKHWYVLFVQDWIRISDDKAKELLAEGAVKVPWSHGKLPHHAPGDLVEDRALGLLMHHWHSGQGDPIYGVGSLFFAGQKPTVEAMQDALYNIQHTIHDKNARFNNADYKELRLIENNLMHRIGMQKSRAAVDIHWGVISRNALGLPNPTKKSPRPPKGTPTGTNISAMDEALYKGNGIIRRVPSVDAPHIRRCINAGLLEAVPGERGAWKLSAKGQATLDAVPPNLRYRPPEPRSYRPPVPPGRTVGAEVIPFPKRNPTKKPASKPTGKQAVPKVQIEHIVGNYHVGEPDDVIRQNIEDRARKAGADAKLVKACGDYAVKVHQRNRNLYHDVMSGNLGGRRRRSRKNPVEAGLTKDTKIPAVRIDVTRTEGGNHDLNIPHHVTGGDVWDKTNALLSLWGAEAARGARNKVKFKVTYADKETYQGVYYVSQADKANAHLGRHILHTIESALGKRKPAHMTAKQYRAKLADVKIGDKEKWEKFLTTYEVGDKPVRKAKSRR